MARLSRLLASLAVLVTATSPSPAPATSIAFLGVRPGIWMVGPSLCTLDFVFSQTGRLADGGPFYIGTAAHCVLTGINVDPRGTPVTAAVVLGAETPPVLLEIGTVAHATKGEPAVGWDLALVRIDARYESILSPSIAILGGPTGVAEGELEQEPAVMVGHGAGLGAGGTARPGLLAGGGGTDFGAYLPVIGGDSGSPVRTASGHAVGIVTHDLVTEFLRAGRPIAGNAGGTRVTLAEQLWGLRVVTCPTVTPWPLYGCPPAG